MKNQTSGYRNIIIWGFILAVFLLLLPGCSAVGKIFGSNSEKKSQEEKSEKVPKQLEALDLTLESLFNDLDGPSANQNEDQPSQDQQQSPSSGGQSPQQGQPKQAQNQNQQQHDPWLQVAEDIKRLHTGWNEYMPEIIKKGAGKELLDAFSSQLNKLTETAKTKNKDKVLMAANELYANIPEMYSLYKIKTVPGLNS
jgi:hypothetical protein